MPSVDFGPVAGLQQMLRAISFGDQRIPRVIPDGIYGENTRAAVSAFQQAHGLPVTGIVDQATFEAIVLAYGEAEELLSPAQPPLLRFPGDLEISPGQSHPSVFLVQGIFAALGQRFPNFQRSALSGALDPATAENLRELQRLSGLPVSGCLDKRSWNRLCRLSRAALDMAQPPAQG
jgi:peptidoglycan hydrolase-like protein with peptidoglycan-binding domain